MMNFFDPNRRTGDYRWGTVHIIAVVIIIISIIALSLILRKKEYKTVNTTMRVIAGVSLVIHVTRHILEAILYDPKSNLGGPLRNLWLFYFCNIMTIGFCILVVFNIRKGREFFMVFGPIGALLAYTMPIDVFVVRHLTFYSLDSITSHLSIMVIPLVLLFTGNYQLSIKKSWQLFVAIFAIAFNAEIIQRLMLNQGWFGPKKEMIDYIFLRSGIPFRVIINGKPSIMLQGALLLLLLGIVIFVYYGTYYLTRTLHRKRAVRKSLSLERRL